ncbi:MAG: hypothetical protein JSV19_02610 [Phycisphaerales bacterium]|nr:MAG: hypothetical protein JSV19_02610 [Phycisphaerales bacterium]
MKEIDRKIREALQAQDAELFDEIGGEPAVHEMVIDSFRGRLRWLVILASVWCMAFLALAVVCAVQFFRANTVREMLGWSTGCVLCIVYVMAMKVWYWMELNKNVVTREVKRLELEIARLAARLPGQTVKTGDDELT